MSRGTPEERRDFIGDGKRVVHVGTIDSPMLMFFDAPTAGLNSVWALDSDGVQVQLLVNTLERYQGVTLILAEVPVVGFQVKSDGPWSVRVRPLDAARPWSGASLTAHGDDVLRLIPPANGFTTAAMRVMEASGNTSVWAFGSERRTLLFNETEPFTSESVVPPGTDLLAVRCDGRWSIQLETSAPAPSVMSRTVDRPAEASDLDVVSAANRLCQDFAAQHDAVSDDDNPDFYWVCPHFGPWADANFADGSLRDRLRKVADSRSSGSSDDEPDELYGFDWASAGLDLLHAEAVPESWWAGIAVSKLASVGADAVGLAAVSALYGAISARLELPPRDRDDVVTLARLVEGTCAIELWWAHAYGGDNFIPMRNVESWWPKYLRVVDRWLTAEDLEALSELAGRYTDTEALSSVTAPARLAMMYSGSSAVKANPRLPADVVNANVADDRDLLFHPNADPETSWAIIRAALESGFDDAYDLAGVCIPFYNMRDDSWFQFAGFATTGPHAEMLQNRIREWCLANMRDEQERDELLESFHCM